MSGATALVGVLLVLPVGFGVVEAIGYRKGRYDSAFWATPLDGKLDHIARHPNEWALMTFTWFPTIAVMVGGLAGLSFLLDDVVGWVAFGAFVLAAVAWLITAAQQVGAVFVGAQQRASTGVTPDWLAATWRVGMVLEGMWIMLGNLAAVGYGAAVLRTELLPGWLGWAAIAVGLAIPIGVLLTRDGFPHLALPVPLALGVALLVT